MAKVLFLTYAERPDYAAQFNIAAKHHTLTVLNISPFAPQPLAQPEQAGCTVKSVFDYPHIQAVLDEYQPDVVVALHIASQLEALFRLACTEKQIPFCLIDHGMSYPGKNILQATEKHQAGIDTPPIPLMRRIKHRMITNRSARHLTTKHQRSFRLCKDALRKIVNSRQLFINLPSEEAKRFLPNHFIAYSQHNYDTFRANYGVEAYDLDHSFIGFPQYDNFAATVATSAAAGPRTAIVIDVPLQNALAFSKEPERILKYNHTLGRALSKVCDKVIFKPHPYSLPEHYQDVEAYEQVETIEEIIPHIPNTCIVFGNISTLMIPFVAQPHITLFSYEEADFGMDGDDSIFVAHGVAEPVRTIEEIEQKIPTYEACLQKQQTNKPAFIQHFAHRADGQSGQRLSDVLESF